MGEVWRAEDTRLGRQVALKLLPPELVDERRLARLEREARALASVSHPGIVTIYSVEEADGRTFLVMELVDGETLDDWIVPGGLPLDAFRPLAESLVEAVAAAHERGIVHRDLKPGNVLVTSTGSAKVLDFGLAKLLEPTSADGSPAPPLTQERALLGTSGYMSPEQAAGMAVDARTDVFCLGILLHQLLTGTHPFARANPLATLTAILTEPPPRLRESRPDVPAAVATSIDRCLAKEAADRPADAAALLAALRATEDAEPGPAADDPPAEGPPPPRGPTRKLRAAATIAVLLGLGVFAFTWPPATRLSPASSRASSAPIRLAVLPFEDRTGNPARGHVVEGLSEGVVSELGRLGGLRVLPLAAASRQAGPDRRPGALAEALDVDWVLSGAVEDSGENLWVSALLTAASDDGPAWSSSYEPDSERFPEVARRLVHDVVARVGPTLTEAERRRLVEPRPVDPGAWDLAQRGFQLAADRTPDGLLRATEWFERATEADPELAEAWAGLAEAWLLLAQYYLVPALEGMPRARTAAEAALELDPRHPRALTVLAAVRSTFEWEWEGAEHAYRAAVEAGPSFPTAHAWLGEHLAILGRFDEALEAIRQARALDPDATVLRFQEAEILYYARRFPAAVELLAAASRERPDEWIFHYGLSFGLPEIGEPVAGLEAARTADGLAGGSVWTRAGLVVALARGGHPDEAARLLAEAEEAMTNAPIQLAMAAAGLGETERALDWLDRSLRHRDPWIGVAATSPPFDPLRSEERFRTFLRTAGLPADP